jgi:signal transduction histidine kinase
MVTPLHTHGGHGPPPATLTSVDVSPEAISSLVAEGMLALAHASTDGARGLDEVDARALLISVTHDMRSPLSAMLMLVERLRAGQTGPLTPQQERLLTIVQSAALTLGALTNDALDLARGGHTLSAEPPSAFALTDVLASVRAVVAPLAEEKQLSVRVSAPPLGRRVGHAGLVHRVLLNLVTNALKFTERGAVTLMVELRGPEHLAISVIDTGVGLPSTLAHSFARPEGFRPSDIALGSVGLALCGTLLLAVGSQLEYEPTPTGGSRFHFVLTLPPAV